MRKITLLTLFCSAGMALVSCSSTLDERIAENQAAFDSLSPQQKLQVVRGQISEGMPPEAVKMVWGNPVSTASGMLNGKPSERWLYSGAGGSGFTVGIRGGVGGFGSSSGMGVGSGVAFPVDYVPSNTPFVLFMNGKVVSWEGEGR